MKFAAVFIMLASFTASARTFSQITIREKNAPLQKVFKVIERQSGYNFLYSSELMQKAGRVTVEVKDASLEQALEECLKHTSLTYSIVDKTIVVKPKQPDQAAVESLTAVSPPAVIKGVVSDAGGKPLEGVSVQLKGSSVGTSTNAAGEFTLEVSKTVDQVLIFSFVGMQTQQLNFTGKTNLTVTLRPVNAEQQEVVVVGYQGQKRSNITGAVSVVNANDVAKQPIGFADQALQGKAAGVRITEATGQPGDGLAIRIRGVGTINNNDPLFIIDGVPTKDGINFLSANDIATITVLKDAASASIYGARSSNGVVVITTKNGGRSGNVNVNYSGYYGVQTHGFLTPMANAQQYKTLYNEAAANDNALVTNPILLRPLISDTVQMANTNWLGAIFRTAPIQSHEIAINGGNDKTQYYISGNVFSQDGIILNSWYNRYNLHSKINVAPTERLHIGVNINLSYYDKNSVGSSGDGLGGNGGSVVRYALFRDPAIPLYNSDHTYSDLSPDFKFFGDGYNPVALAQYTQNKEKQFRTFGDVFAEYRFGKNLTFKTDFGGDVFLNGDKTFNRNYGTNNRINNPNTLVETNLTSVNMLWDNTLRYSKTFASVNHLTVLLGTEAISNSTTAVTASDRDFPIQIPSLEFLGNGLGQTNARPSESLNEWALFSLFANVNYDYNNRYFLTASGRRDGSSRFGPNNRYANFFSGSLGWDIASESWFQKALPSISKLKVRASYGQLGNQDIGNYPFASIVSPNYNVVFGQPQQSQLGYTLSSRGNANIKWESSTQADAGLDVGILNDHLSLAADYFIKTTTNMLVQVPLPEIGGSAGAPNQNNGSVRNQGFEFELNYRNDAGRVKYRLNANFATLQNKVLSLANNTPIQGGRIDNGVYATLTAVGHPIGSFYGYQMEGIFQNTSDIFKHAFQANNVRPGDVMYKDVNGDGKIDQNDRTFLGSAIPKFTYGFTANIEYSNFDLSLFFQGAYGNKIYLQVNQDIEGFYRPFNVTQRVYEQRWHGEGTSNTMPLVSWADAANNILEPSSRFLEGASYVRLKNAQLGYTIPSKAMQRIHIKGIRVYVTAQNLLTITKFTGLDPEMHISNNVNVERYPGDVAAGIDWGTYPSAKSYIIGLNVNF